VTDWAGGETPEGGTFIHAAMDTRIRTLNLASDEALRTVSRVSLRSFMETAAKSPSGDSF